MFNNCYRPGCHFDMNRCNCPRCNKKWEDDYENEKDYDKDYNKNDFENQNQCCFPMDICLTVKEGKNKCDKKQNKYNEYDYDYGYEEKQNDYNYPQNDRYDNYNQKDYNRYNQKDCDKKDNKHDEDDKCKHECCFPIDICFSIKEHEKERRNKERNCENKHEDWDKNDRNYWNENDRCDLNKHHYQNRPCNNRSNCCLGLLGFLIGRCGR